MSFFSRTTPGAASAETSADELISPLLSKDADYTVVSSCVYSDTGDEITPKLTTGQVLQSAVVASCVTAGAVTSIVSFIMYPAIIVYVAGGICLMNCPIVLYNQRKMMALDTLRGLVNGLRHQVELLDEAIEQTEKEIDDLKIVQTRFSGVEEEFQDIAKDQHSSVEKIVDLVKENNEILNSMRENLRQRIIQDVIGTVVRTDGGDQKFDRVEAKILALKIKVKLEVYGIYFDEDKFLKAIALNPSLSGAITVVRKLLPMEYQEDEDEFGKSRMRSSCASHYDDDESLDEDDIYDMFYMSREEQEQRESVLAVRAQFGRASSSRRISLASTYRTSGHRLSDLVRSRLASVDDIIFSGVDTMFPVIEE